MGLDVDVWESDWEALKSHPEYVPVTRGYEGRPNIVATIKGSGGGRSLLLNGHTDTVPPGPPEAWSHDPHDADVSDDRLYGRGSSDMKSGVAAMVMALKCLVGAGIRLEGDVFLNLVVDEELSGHGTLDTLLRGYRADAAICAETSGNAFSPRASAASGSRSGSPGKAAGIQRRYLGVNAIDLATRSSRRRRAREATAADALASPVPGPSTPFPAWWVRSPQGAFPVHSLTPAC